MGKVLDWIAILAVDLGIAVRVQAASTIQFTEPSATVSESAGSVLLSVQRTGEINTEVGVDYATNDGTATNELKYSAVFGTLVFRVGETNGTILVPILDGGFVDGNKSFVVRLSNPTAGAVLGARTNSTVVITDNDFGIQFQSATNAVIEDEGAAKINVVRGDDGNLPVTVNFFTTDLTARAGLDFTGVTNVLSFAPQERLKSISIPILNNSLKQPNRTFRVTLTNPNGATLGSQTVNVVMILDNDSGFQFDLASYSVAEDAGVARIGVLRGTDDTNSPVTVDFATSDLTATNGLEYKGITNTLLFAPGERVKLVSVPILNDGTKEPTKSFRVALSNPTGGALLGSARTASVNILDNDPGIGFELASYSVWENAGAITIAVLGGNDVVLWPITADYATSDLTAEAGKDYQAVSGTLAFEQNETVKVIIIPILRNELVRNNTSFKVTLGNPTAGATLGRASTIVGILDAPGLGTYRTIAPPFNTALTIQIDHEFNTLTWSGESKLQKADRLPGPWQTLTNAVSPSTFQPIVPTAFYRVTLPNPVKVYIPFGYDGHVPTPLVILLHGLGSTGDDIENYFQLRPQADLRGFLYCSPDSPADRAGNVFWNATDGCCDFFNTGRNDAGYLRDVIEEIGTQFAVDAKRIYLIGHSNGGFMAYRMACQSADLIAGIASVAGMTFLDPSRCQPSQPVNILHIPGTADTLASYGGGADTIIPGNFPANTPPYPSVRQTIQIWASYNRASDAITEFGPSMDLDLDIPGPDTVITRYTNYPSGGAIELWNINGASHFPNLSPEFASHIIEWLLAHPKP